MIFNEAETLVLPQGLLDNWKKVVIHTQTRAKYCYSCISKARHHGICTYPSCKEVL